MAYREIIHIGANKSASTTLQRQLFPKIEKLVYLGEDCEGYEAFRSTLNHMIYEDDFNYTQDKIEKLFNEYKAKAKSSDVTFLYSNEDIMTSRIPSQVLSRLKKNMPDAKVLLIIRNQMDAIPSWYANHGAFLKGVPKRFWRRYVSADEFMDHFTSFLNYGPFDCFMYNKILNKYSEAFGKENIKILFFEDFVKNKEFFIKELSSFMNIDSKTALELVQGSAERKRITQKRFTYHKLNRFLPMDTLFNASPEVIKRGVDSFLDSGKKATNLGMSKWDSKIAEIFREDNRELEKNYNINLKKYNYPL